MRGIYSKYMIEENAQGSNKASSYIRAIELLGKILERKAPKEFRIADIWNVSSVSKTQRLYEYIIEQQGLENGIFCGESPPSYWQNKFYSAAIGSYKKFLISTAYENQLWDIYRTPTIGHEDLVARLATVEVVSIEDLVPEGVNRLSGKTGREVIREAKSRLDQRFFRKMILSQYRTQCCVTGLNVPEVLRASHIAGWAEDTYNRLNPANGLCLSATYDAAFDRHLISFDHNYEMVLSTKLRDYCTNDAFKQYFEAFEGRRILLPRRFEPDRALLNGHRDKLLS